MEVLTQQEQALVDAAKQQGKMVAIATLTDKDGLEDYGDAIVATPSITALNQFERNIDRDPLKAKLILIKATFLTRTEEATEAIANTAKFAAMFNAASQMIQQGKAVIKNL